MDPIQNLYQQIRTINMKIGEYDREIIKATDQDVKNAYSTIKGVHVSTLVASQAVYVSTLQNYDFAAPK